MAGTIRLELTEDQALLLAEALDSHIYWQLSSPEYRRDGTVVEPGNDDGESASGIRAAMQMYRQLEARLGRSLCDPIGPRMESSG